MDAKCELDDSRAIQFRHLKWFSYLNNFCLPYRGLPTPSSLLSLFVAAIYFDTGSSHQVHARIHLRAGATNDLSPIENNLKCTLHCWDVLHSSVMSECEVAGIFTLNILP